jgi:NADH pyrophosphatase NudC (nudix superfamily)
MYSCIAGYVDSGIHINSSQSYSLIILKKKFIFFCVTGETLEESICREVAEEVGLSVLNVEYKASQHWSFPTSNLMIGCHAVVSGKYEKTSDYILYFF